MTQIHPFIKEHKIFFSCGVWDVLSAKIAEKAGFRSIVVSGYAVSASYLGEPDIGLLTQTQILETARRICQAVKISVIVDGDTGYGGALNVQSMVKELIQMGAKGILLEDQTWPKRCGHLAGKSVLPKEEHIAKIRSAKEAKANAPFAIIARTDALEPLGLEEAILRGKLYKEAGADLIFIEAPRTKEELKRIAKEVPGPLVVNVIEGGRTPVLELEEYQELGFISVGYVLTGLFASAKAIMSAYSELLEKGTSKAIQDKLISFSDFTDLLGLPEKLAIDKKFSQT